MHLVKWHNIPTMVIPSINARHISLMISTACFLLTVDWWNRSKKWSTKMSKSPETNKATWLPQINAFVVVTRMHLHVDCVTLVCYETETGLIATHRAVQVLATASATLGRYSDPENEQTASGKSDKQQTKTRLSHAKAELQAIARYNAWFYQISCSYMYSSWTCN